MKKLEYLKNINKNLKKTCWFCLILPNISLKPFKYCYVEYIHISIFKLRNININLLINCYKLLIYHAFILYFNQY